MMKHLAAHYHHVLRGLSCCIWLYSRPSHSVDICAVAQVVAHLLRIVALSLLHTDSDAMALVR